MRHLFRKRASIRLFSLGGRRSGGGGCVKRLPQENAGHEKNAADSLNSRMRCARAREKGSGAEPFARSASGVRRFLIGSLPIGNIRRNDSCPVRSEPPGNKMRDISRADTHQRARRIFCHSSRVSNSRASFHNRRVFDSSHCLRLQKSERCKSENWSVQGVSYRSERFGRHSNKCYYFEMCGRLVIKNKIPFWLLAWNTCFEVLHYTNTFSAALVCVGL